MDIASLLEVQVNEVQPTSTSEKDITENKIEIVTLKPSQLISNDEMSYYRRMFNDDFAKVRFRRLHCTACDGHIGSAPSEAPNIQEHPILKTLLCSSCRDFYGDGNFEQGDDATDMFCRWCANGGNLYCCSYCSNTFCDKCIKRNFEADVRNKIEADEKWKCFVCDPSDLYTLRAVCRALLHHIKTLARILMADRTMSAKDIEGKMELDDSKCCNRRSRRRRRESSSDEESLQRSRSPSQKRNRKNNWSNSKRRKSSSQNDKPNVTVLNGTSRFIPIAPRFVLQEMVPSTTKYRNDDDDIPPPLLHCEQTMIEGDNETVSSQGMIVPSNSQSKIPDSILYNSAISLNPLPSQNMIRGPMTRGGKYVPMRPLRKIDSLPPGTTPQVIRRLTAYPTRPSAPMVAIPSVAKPKTNTNTNTPPPPPPATPSVEPSAAQRSNYLRCKSNLTNEPNVIDLESDTEDLIILEGRSNSNESAVDQACGTEEVSTQWEDISPSPLPAHLRRKVFEETMDNPIIAIDKLLEKLRERLKYDLNSVIDVPDNNDIHNCRVKIKIINRNIDEIVNELAAFNNSMIRRYQPWKEYKITSDMEDDDITRPIVLKKGERSSKYVPLQMECVRDSGSDMEDDDDDDVDIEYVLSFSKRLTNFDEKGMINKGTLTRVETKDKAVQAYDTVTMDYDKAIGYSLLMRADYDFERKREVFKPVVIHDKFFGKYEEQFISYLQSFEDRRDFVDEKDCIKKTSSNDLTLTEIIDADIAAHNAAESFIEVCDDPDVGKCAAESRNLGKEKENKDEKIDKMETIVKIRDKMSKKIVKPPAKIDDNKRNNDSVSSPVEMTSSQEAKHEETVFAVRALIEKESNESNVIVKWKNSEDDDECTILE